MGRGLGCEASSNARKRVQEVRQRKMRTAERAAAKRAMLQKRQEDILFWKSSASEIEKTTSTKTIQEELDEALAQEARIIEELMRQCDSGTKEVTTDTISSDKAVTPKKPEVKPKKSIVDSSVESAAPKKTVQEELDDALAEEARIIEELTKQCEADAKEVTKDTTDRWDEPVIWDAPKDSAEKPKSKGLWSTITGIFQ